MLNISSTYGPTRANPPTTAYPFGSIKNESVPNANDGTPLDQAWGNDGTGFDAALMRAAGMTPNNNADTAESSQRLDAMLFITGRVVNTKSDITNANIALGQRVATRGYASVGDGGAAEYIIKSGSVTDTFGDQDAGNNRYAELQPFANLPTLRQYGGVFNGTTDNLARINAALNTWGKLYLDDVKGTPTNQETIDVAVSNTVVLRQYDELHIGRGITLGIPTSLSNTNNPVVFLRSSYIKLKGQHLHGSFIKHQNSHPDGVVKYGADSMSTQTEVSQKCDVSDFTIFGATRFGKTSGDPDILFHVPAPQLPIPGGGEYFTYYSNIRRIGFEGGNVGLWLRGFANGMQISDLYGVNIGNDSAVPAYFIWVQGNLDNNVRNTFFNQSPDATGLVVENLDNRANGSAELMRASYNTFNGIICEQGGTVNSRAVDIRASLQSHYEIIDNVFQGSNIYAGFDDDNNTLHATQSTRLNDTTVKSLNVGSSVNVQRSTSGDSSQEGMSVGDGVTNSITSDNDISILFNRINGGGRIADFRIDGLNVGQVYSTGSGIISLTGPNAGIQLRDTFVAPCDDDGALLNNTLASGDPSARYTTIYLTNNPDVSSDRNLKTDEDELSDWMISAGREIKSNIKIWRWAHKVAMTDDENEGDNARYHTGPMAQDVVNILKKHAPEGFDVFNLSLISKSVLDKETRYSIKPTEIMWLIMAGM